MGDDGRTVRLQLPKQSQLFFFGLLAVMFFLTWTIFRPFVIYMIVGVFVAVLALPVDRFWERIVPNRVAAFFTMFTIAIIIAAPFVAMGFALFDDAQTLTEEITSGRVEDDLNDLLDVVYPDQTPDERNETVDQLWGQLEPRVTGFLQDLAGRLVGFVGDFLLAFTVILFVVYYVLTDGHLLVDFLKRTAPLPRQQMGFLLAEAHNGLRAVFVGQILTSLIQGGLGGIGFLIAGVPGAILWAGVMAILSLLPVVGAFIVWVPAAAVLFIQGQMWQAIFLTAWGVVVVSQVDNLIRPRLIGDRAHIHPLFVLLGVLGGVAAFGFIGLFLGPLLVGVTLSVLKVWESDYLDPVVGRDDDTEDTLPVIRSRTGKASKGDGDSG
ncbi:MAG: AI-2E family transporter [Thermoplasmatota archaeon]